MEYSVLANGEKIGISTVEHIGLYGHIYCCCRGADMGICRIIMEFSDKTIDLGLWVPEKDCFIVRKAIPWKRFGCGEPKFLVIPNNLQAGRFQEPLEAGEPISKLEILSNCRLYFKQDRVYLQT